MTELSKASAELLEDAERIYKEHRAPGRTVNRVEIDLSHLSSEKAEAHVQGIKDEIAKRRVL